MLNRCERCATRNGIPDYGDYGDPEQDDVCDGCDARYEASETTGWPMGRQIGRWRRPTAIERLRRAMS